MTRVLDFGVLGFWGFRVLGFWGFGVLVEIPPPSHFSPATNAHEVVSPLPHLPTSPPPHTPHPTPYTPHPTPIPDN
ncbi:MAG: hypothetical protein GPJ13_10520 [Microcystis aeruginosa W11-06]|nr:hypothetical protein [Microcystis aeruginosa W11-03]NCR94173.1 hypothetical protein [Microcystis aeruginosa W11-06]